MAGHLELQPKLTCPNCWVELDPADLLWVSSHPDLRGDPFLGDDALKRFLPSRFDVDGFALDARGSRCQSLACPKCHLAIPRILTEIKPAIISVLGAPRSGKSYFLAAAVWEARKRFHGFNITFTDADPVANREISKYEKKLFLNDKLDQIVAIEKTEVEGGLYQKVEYGGARVEFYARPFVYAMRPTEAHALLKKGKAVRRVSRALCLYDNAGEHFQPSFESDLSPATDHLALSEALIFVFDPLQHPRFRKRCREHSQDPQLGDEFICHRQDEILLEAAKRIRQKANIATHERFKRPLIIAVNKYDSWEGLLPELDLRRVSPFARLSDGAIGMNLATLKPISAQVESLIRQTSPEIVAACESFCDDITFIPMSPQGCSPIRGEESLLGVRPGDISPVWAEVPLLYAISKAKCALLPVAPMAAAAPEPDVDGPDLSDDDSTPHIYRGTG
jgi:hypothetical protein